ncbi:MAG TPA: tRNA lysidine(34) synthetase TilS [Desulfuromonadaceae bacterium]
MTTISAALRARFARTILEKQLFKPGDCLIVAISGGADSTTLLHLLANLDGFSLRLVAAHLNHCLRGIESDGDEDFSRKLAADLNIPFETRRVDVKELAHQQGLNLEDAGRRARTAFLEELRVLRLGSAIAVAHHSDDQAETVLMRLLRGSGAGGLAGMSAINDHRIIRPLLGFSRAEIEHYLQEQGLTYREDSSNLDTSFLRNRIRHQLLPLLEEYNPAIRDRLNTCARLLADEDQLLLQYTGELMSRCCECEGNIASCDIEILRNAHPALRRRVYRLIFKGLIGNAKLLSNLHIEAVERLIISGRPNARLNLPQNIAVVRQYGCLQFISNSSQTDILSEITISGPGHYPLANGETLTIGYASGTIDHASISADTAVFDEDYAPFPWQVRPYRNGDRMVPLGMNGSKKIKDIFIDSKVPLSQRRQTPLIFSGKHLIWTCGLRTSNIGKLTEASVKIIKAVYTHQPNKRQINDD